MLIKDLGSGICLKGRIINGLLVGEGKKKRARIEGRELE
jgi:hypothetical protein